MKVVLKVLAAFALILSVSSFVLITDPQVTSDANSIIASDLNLLFDAIFQSVGTDQIQNGLFNNTSVQDQNCLNTFSVENIVMLSVGGLKIRLCVHVSGWQLEQYFLTHSSEVLRKTFETSILQCGAKGNTQQQTINCYSDAIAKAFEVISGTGSIYYTQTEQCIQSELEQMVEELNQYTVQLQNCVAQQ